jgi:hypothetical protein
MIENTATDIDTFIAAIPVSEWRPLDVHTVRVDGSYKLLGPCYSAISQSDDWAKHDPIILVGPHWVAIVTSFRGVHDFDDSIEFYATDKAWSTVGAIVEPNTVPLPDVEFPAGGI